MATVVGSVVASIVPDVSGFVPQADAALTPAVERLGRKLGETISRSLTRALDFSGINTGLQRALDRAEAQAASSGRDIGQGFSRAVRTEIALGLRHLPEVRVPISLDSFSVAQYRAQLAYLTAPQTQTVTVDVRTNGAQGDLLGLRRGTGDATESLGSPGGGGGLIGALKGFGAAAGVAALPSLGALVPIMAGAALGAGTLKLGLNGVSDALEQAGKDEKKYREALKQLSPEQRALTKAVVGLKKEFAPIGREVQKAMLPSFTKTVKAAGPVVRILGRGMTEMADVFGDAADGVTQLLKDSGFQKDFGRTLKLGTGFVRETTKALGPFTKSLLDFAAASGPTVKSFSDGMSGLLGMGLPAFFSGLKGGIQGSADMVRGLFDGINSLLGGLGRFSGAFSRNLGPLLGSLLRYAGDLTTAFLDGLVPALDALGPTAGSAASVFERLDKLTGPLAKGLGTVLGGAVELIVPVFKNLFDLGSIAIPVITNLASAIVGPLLSAFTQVSTADEGLNNLRGGIKDFGNLVSDNKVTIEHAMRRMAVAVLDFVIATVTLTPQVFHAFQTMTNGVLDTLGMIANGLAMTLGELPGIGEKVKAGASSFNTWRSGVKRSMESAGTDIDDFAAKALPKLQQGKLKLETSEFDRGLAASGRALRSANLDKTGKLKGDKAPFDQALAAVRAASVAAKSVVVKADTSSFFASIGAIAGRVVANAYVNVGGVASGKVKRASGGPVWGPGSGTSDSIPAMLSNGEYVVRAKSVAKYGLSFLHAVNQGTLGISRLASGGLADPDVASGLAVGMVGSASMVNEAARVMASEVEAGIRKELQIASPSKKMIALAKEIGAGLIKGLTGTRAQIKSTSASLAKDIWDTFSGSTDNRLAAMLNQRTKRLLDLAAKRDKFAAAYAAGQQMAKDQRSAGLSFASMTALPNGGNTFDAGGILSGLNVRLGQLKAFSANVAKLAKMGLSKELLGQIIAAGPDGGAAYAAALVQATPAQLKALNSTQSQISKASSSYGNSAADIMYDAGSKAGQGFLTGLKAQQKSIEGSMSSLAKAIQSAIKKALKIKSPSRVMADIGEDVAQGLVMGIDATHAAVVSSANRMALAVQQGVQVEPATRIQQVRENHFHMTTVDKPTRQAVMDALRDDAALYSPLIPA
ncbi:hypothetical protein ACFV3E_05810 [Streptomyces sp. NPDC059718]